MNIETHITLSGWLLVALALMHIGFPRYFDWRRELAGLSLINRQMMKVHTLFIALGLLLSGLLCVSSATELGSTTLGRRLALGFASFWGVRLLVQFSLYPAELWRGRRFETVVHAVFSALWLYLTTVFAIVAVGPHG